MRLEGDIAQVLQADDAQAVGGMQDLGYGQRNRTQQPSHRDERQRGDVDGAGVKGQHNRRALREMDTVVASVRRIAGQGDNALDVSGEPLFDEVRLDAWINHGRAGSQSGTTP